MGDYPPTNYPPVMVFDSFLCNLVPGAWYDEANCLTAKEQSGPTFEIRFFKMKRKLGDGFHL